MLNVATPFETVAVAVFEPPEKVPLLRVRVTIEELSPVKVLPNWSCTVTCTGGLSAMPALPLVGGSWLKINLDSEGGGMGVNRLPLPLSPAASAMVTLLVTPVVPRGIEAFRSNEKTKEPVTPAAKAPTAKV